MVHTKVHSIHPEHLNLFSNSEGLRTVLNLLHTIGPDSWRVLPIARDLMIFTAHRFRPVALSWGRDQWEAASAAFLAMRENSVRSAEDPWAAITRAVQRAMIAEAEGERSLLSTDKARRPEKRPDAKPIRAGEYEEFIFDVLAPALDGTTEAVPDLVVQIPASMLIAVGWSVPEALSVVEYVCHRIADLGSHASAIDTLRRDHSMRVRCDLTTKQWGHLIGFLVGNRRNPEDVLFGAIIRVLTGDTLDDLLSDAELCERLINSAPTHRLRSV